MLGLSQLKKLNYNINVRRHNLDIWLNCLDSDKFKTDFHKKGNSNFALPLILNDPKTNLMQKIYNKLNDLGVEYRSGTAGGGNLARQPFVKNYPHIIADNQFFVNHIHEFGLYVGNGTHVKTEQIIELASHLNQLN